VHYIEEIQQDNSDKGRPTVSRRCSASAAAVSRSANIDRSAHMTTDYDATEEDALMTGSSICKVLLKELRIHVFDISYCFGCGFVGAAAMASEFVWIACRRLYIVLKLLSKAHFVFRQSSQAESPEVKANQASHSLFNSLCWAS